MSSERPPPIFSSFSVNVSDDARAQQLDFAVAHGYGIETRDFSSWGGSLDDPEVRAQLIAWYRRELPRVRGPVTAHGPSADLSFGGEDATIVAVSRARVLSCLEAMERIGVSRVVFHTTFHHPEPQPWYVKRWVQRHTAFWQDLLAGREVEVLLENSWEPGPEVLRDAADAIGLPNVGLCFDAGHAHLHTPTPLTEWVQLLGGRIRQLHLHDNARVYDQHLVPGGGTIDWGALAAALRAAGLCLPAVLEIPENRVAAAVQLLQRL